MKAENINALENLSAFCHFTGLISVFIGIVLAFMNLLSGTVQNIPIGIYIFFSGYGLVKIASKLSDIVQSEKFQQGI